MNKRKVLFSFGTRPEAVKMAPLVLKLEKDGRFEPIVCVTAQHRQMLDQVLDIFKIHPQVDLGIMRPGQTLGYITNAVLNGMEKVVKEYRPDIVLVHGDTTTTFAGALAAFYNQVPVGHVEAGLRTFSRYSPFPEEMNRRLVSDIATLHFAPTVSNRENLFRENIRENVFVTGNTVIDAIGMTVRPGYRFKSPSLSQVSGFRGRILLMEAHRRENLGEPLRNICRAVRKIARDYPDVLVVWPVHLNPAVRGVAHEILGGVQNVLLCDPIDVEDMHNLMAKAYLVMTDSGGLQEEAPALGRPVLVLRTETERPEAVKAGTVKMAGIREDEIYDLTSRLLTDQDAYGKMAHAVNPYGDGHACERIIRTLAYYFGFGEKPDEFQPE